MRGRDFLGGVLIGAVVGAALGLLLAPQSGEETRETLCSTARELSDKMKESSRQLLDSGRDLLEQGKTQISQTIKNRTERAEAPGGGGTGEA